MTRNWKTNKQITELDQIHYCWKDLILDDKFGITEADWNAVIQKTVEHIHSWTQKDIKGRVSCMIELLLPQLDVLWRGKVGQEDELSFRSFRWLPCRSLPGATVADHALTASAIAYCLAYDLDPRPKIETLDRLRLSALTVTWKEDGLDAVYDALWSGESPIEPEKEGSELERIVFLAKTAASKRTKIKNVQFNDHPLNGKKQIGLVLGGATKIKGYFLESAKLPEIRGASALLDRINLEDIPALFGRKNPHDPKRAVHFHKDFYKRTGHNLSAPECIIYAAGGNTLAFTPASIGHDIADEIERIYTKETLVANSVAVGDTFDLLELQYGLNPTRFWVEDFREASVNPETSELMENYYGGKEDKDFFKRKCFGELTSKLAGAQLKRREGNLTPDRETLRDLPTHVEIGPYQVRCESCERRSAVINRPKVLCAACTRKYVIGRITKKETDALKEQHGIDYYLKHIPDWEPATRKEDGGWCFEDWGSLYKKYLLACGKAAIYHKVDPTLMDIDGPQALEDIAEASRPENYIAFIYADGNNMGGYLENIASPAQYRQFSERVFITLQKATFDALAEHLTPTKSNVHPFEIVSIGGDDLLLIVPGSQVFEIVNRIGENFDSEFNSYARLTDKDKLRPSQRYTPRDWMDAQKMQPVFSLSLGFVIAEAHTPVGFLEHLADNLLKSAKTRAKTLIADKVGYRGGTVDFLVLKSISMIASNLGDFREQFYETDNGDSLTMRPFTLHELSGFIKTIQDFKKGEFPRSQIYQLRQSLELGRATSTLDYLYFRSRLDSEDGDKLQKQIEENWQGITGNKGDLGPWYLMLKAKETDDEHYETLLLDLIEAYDFIAKPKAPNKEDNSDESNN